MGGTKHNTIWLFNTLFIFTILCGVMLGTYRPAQAAIPDVRIDVGETRQVLLGATITSGRLLSGSWASSNKSV